MCMPSASPPKVEKTEPITPPPPPEPTPDAPVISEGSKRSSKTSTKAKRTGTSALRIPLLVAGPASGGSLNIPR